MSQQPFPGVVQQNAGASYLGTPGLHVPSSGGVSTKAVNFDELSAVRAQLEQAFNSANTADTVAWQSAIANLSSQVNNALAGIIKQVTVATIWSDFSGLGGLVTQLQNNNHVVNGIDFAAVTPQSPLEDAGILVLNPGFSTENGIYRYNPAASGWPIDRAPGFTKAAEFPPGTLIYIDKGTAEANSFYLVADEAAANGNGDVAGLNLIPFGRFTQLQAAAGSPFAIAANTISLLHGAGLSIKPDGSGGFELDLSQEFLDRIAAIEVKNTSQDAAIASLQTAAQAETARLNSTIATSAAQATAISAIETASAAQTAAISATQVSLTELDAEVTTLAADLSALEANVANGANQAAIMATIAAFYKAQKKIMTLTGGVFANNSTTFYVDPGFGSLRFSVSRLSESAAPFEELDRPSFEYTTVNAANIAGNYVKITFYHSTAVPNNTIEAYCDRFYGDSETVPVTYVNA